MKILMICKYPPIQGGVSADAYWTAQLFSELGHEVQVITNAPEVEEEYKIQLNEDDEKLLTGYRLPKSIVVHNSYIDQCHVFIPQNNPSVSKLVGIGLKVIEEMNPDLIWSFYVEPYGVAALLLSKLTGIPYTIRHAGSDLGRLMLTDQLKPLYYEVFRNAALVLTNPSHFPKFKEMGVNEKKMIQYVSVRVPADVFYLKPMPTEKNFTVGIYGKSGNAKGSLELIRAMSLLKNENFPITLKALWGGQFLSKVRQEIEVLDVADSVLVQNYIPHWKVPDFIWSCHLVLFLENNFSISFHGPGVPIESLCCGRPVLTTEEIEKKRPDILKKGENCIVIPSSPLKPEDIAVALKEAYTKICSGWPETEWPDSGLIGVRTRKAMTRLLAQIQAIIS